MKRYIDKTKKAFRSNAVRNTVLASSILCSSAVMNGALSLVTAQNAEAVPCVYTGLKTQNIAGNQVCSSDNPGDGPSLLIQNSNALTFTGTVDVTGLKVTKAGALVRDSKGIIFQQPVTITDIQEENGNLIPSFYLNETTGLVNVSSVTFESTLDIDNTNTINAAGYLSKDQGATLTNNAISIFDGAVTIKNSTDYGIYLTSLSDGTFNGPVTVSGIDRSSTGLALDDVYGIHIESSKAVFNDVVSSTNNEAVNLTGSQFAASSGANVTFNSAASFAATQLLGAQTFGAKVESGATVVFGNTLDIDDVDYGINVTGLNSDLTTNAVTITNTTLANNKTMGLKIEDQANVLIQGALQVTKAAIGASAIGNSTVTIGGTTTISGGNDGVRALTGAKITFNGAVDISDQTTYARANGNNSKITFNDNLTITGNNTVGEQGLVAENNAFIDQLENTIIDIDNVGDAGISLNNADMLFRGTVDVSGGGTGLRIVGNSTATFGQNAVPYITKFLLTGNDVGVSVQGPGAQLIFNNSFTGDLVITNPVSAGLVTEGGNLSSFGKNIKVTNAVDSASLDGIRLTASNNTFNGTVSVLNTNLVPNVGGAGVSADNSVAIFNGAVDLDSNFYGVSLANSANLTFNGAVNIDNPVAIADPLSAGIKADNSTVSFGAASALTLANSTTGVSLINGATGNFAGTSNINTSPIGLSINQSTANITGTANFDENSSKAINVAGATASLPGTGTINITDAQIGVFLGATSAVVNNTINISKDNGAPVTGIFSTGTNNIFNGNIDISGLSGAAISLDNSTDTFNGFTVVNNNGTGIEILNGSNPTFSTASLIITDSQVAAIKVDASNVSFDSLVFNNNTVGVDIANAGDVTINKNSTISNSTTGINVAASTLTTNAILTIDEATTGLDVNGASTLDGTGTITITDSLTGADFSGATANVASALSISQNNGTANIGLLSDTGASTFTGAVAVNNLAQIGIKLVGSSDIFNSTITGDGNATGIDISASDTSQFNNNITLSNSTTTAIDITDSTTKFAGNLILSDNAKSILVDGTSNINFEGDVTITQPNLVPVIGNIGVTVNAATANFAVGKTFSADGAYTGVRALNGGTVNFNGDAVFTNLTDGLVLDNASATLANAATFDELAGSAIKIIGQTSSFNASGPITITDAITGIDLEDTKLTISNDIDISEVNGTSKTGISSFNSTNTFNGNIIISDTNTRAILLSGGADVLTGTITLDNNNEGIRIVNSSTASLQGPINITNTLKRGLDVNAATPTYEGDVKITDTGVTAIRVRSNASVANFNGNVTITQPTVALDPLQEGLFVDGSTVNFAVGKTFSVDGIYTGANITSGGTVNFNGDASFTNGQDGLVITDASVTLANPAIFDNFDGAAISITGQTSKFNATGKITITDSKIAIDLDDTSLITNNDIDISEVDGTVNRGINSSSGTNTFGGAISINNITQQAISLTSSKDVFTGPITADGNSTGIRVTNGSSPTFQNTIDLANSTSQALNIAFSSPTFNDSLTIKDSSLGISVFGGSANANFNGDVTITQPNLAAVIGNVGLTVDAGTANFVTGKAFSVDGVYTGASVINGGTANFNGTASFTNGTEGLVIDNSTVTFANAATFDEFDGAAISITGLASSFTAPGKIEVKDAGTGMNFKTTSVVVNNEIVISKDNGTAVDGIVSTDTSNTFNGNITASGLSGTGIRLDNSSDVFAGIVLVNNNNKGIELVNNNNKGIEFLNGTTTSFNTNDVTVSGSADTALYIKAASPTFDSNVILADNLKGIQVLDAASTANFNGNVTITKTTVGDVGLTVDAGTANFVTGKAFSVNGVNTGVSVVNSGTANFNGTASFKNGVDGLVINNSTVTFANTATFDEFDGAAISITGLSSSFGAPDPITVTDSQTGLNLNTTKLIINSDINISKSNGTAFVGIESTNSNNTFNGSIVTNSLTNTGIVLDNSTDVFNNTISASSTNTGLRIINGSAPTFNTGDITVNFARGTSVVIDSSSPVFNNNLVLSNSQVGVDISGAASNVAFNKDVSLTQPFFISNLTRPNIGFNIDESKVTFAAGQTVLLDGFEDAAIISNGANVTFDGVTNVTNHLNGMEISDASVVTFNGASTFDNINSTSINLNGATGSLTFNADTNITDTSNGIRISNSSATIGGTGVINIGPGSGSLNRGMQIVNSSTSTINNEIKVDGASNGIRIADASPQFTNNITTSNSQTHIDIRNGAAPIFDGNIDITAAAGQKGILLENNNSAVFADAKVINITDTDTGVEAINGNALFKGDLNVSGSQVGLDVTGVSSVAFGENAVAYTTNAVITKTDVGVRATGLNANIIFNDSFSNDLKVIDPGSIGILLQSGNKSAFNGITITNSAGGNDITGIKMIDSFNEFNGNITVTNNIANPNIGGAGIHLINSISNNSFNGDVKVDSSFYGILLENNTDATYNGLVTLTNNFHAIKIANLSNGTFNNIVTADGNLRGGNGITIEDNSTATFATNVFVNDSFINGNAVNPESNAIGIINNSVANFNGNVEIIRDPSLATANDDVRAIFIDQSSQGIFGGTVVSEGHERGIWIRNQSQGTFNDAVTISKGIDTGSANTYGIEIADNSSALFKGAVSVSNYNPDGISVLNQSDATFESTVTSTNNNQGILVSNADINLLGDVLLQDNNLGFVISNDAVVNVQSKFEAIDNNVGLAISNQNVNPVFAQGINIQGGDFGFTTGNSSFAVNADITASGVNNNAGSAIGLFALSDITFNGIVDIDDAARSIYVTDAIATFSNVVDIENAAVVQNGPSINGLKNNIGIHVESPNVDSSITFSKALSIKNAGYGIVLDKADQALFNDNVIISNDAITAKTTGIIAELNIGGNPNLNSLISFTGDVAVSNFDVGIDARMARNIQFNNVNVSNNNIGLWGGADLSMTNLPVEVNGTFTASNNVTGVDVADGSINFNSLVDINNSTTAIHAGNNSIFVFNDAVNLTDNKIAIEMLGNGLMTFNKGLNVTNPNVAPTEEIFLRGVNDTIIFNSDEDVNAAIRAEIDNLGVVIFNDAPTVSRVIGEPVRKLERVEFALDDNQRTLTLQDDVYANTIITNGLVLGIDQSLVLCGDDIISKNTTFDLGPNTVTIDGNWTHADPAGGIVINTVYDGVNGGHFEFGNPGTNIDLTNASNMTFNITEAPNTPNPQAGEIRELDMFVGNGLNNLSLLDENLVLINFDNPFVTWTFDSDEGVLSQQLVNNVKNVVIDALDPNPNLPDALEDEAFLQNIINTINNNGIAAANDLLNQIADNDSVIVARTPLDTVRESVMGAVTGRMIVVGAGDESENKHGAWATAVYGTNTQKKLLNLPGFKSYYAGGIVGADTKVREYLTLGLGFSIIDTRINHTDQNLGDRTDAMTYTGSFYTNYNISDKWSLENVFSYSYSRVNGKEVRITPVPNTFLIAASKYTEREVSNNLTLGYKRQLPYDMEVKPFVGLDYDSIGAIHYTETGAGVLNLKFARKTMHQLDGRIGAELSKKFYINDFEVKAEVHANMRNAISERKIRTDIRLARNNAVQIVPRTAKTERRLFNYGGSVTINNNDVDLLLNYEHYSATKFTGHQGSIKVKIRF